MQRLLATTIFVLSAFIGVAAFLYPFLLPRFGIVQPEVSTQATNLTLVLLLFTLAVLVLEVQGQSTNARIVAALGVLIAATSVLRFIEVAIPGPGGFSPIFVPIIIAGYVFGARFGFLMGTMTLFVSALITGGIGPWLPYQMFAAGWVGLTAGLLPHPRQPARQLAVLVGFSVLWGFLYGFIMNLFFWPFMNPAAAAGTAVDDMLFEYGSFYLATSAVWDFTRAVGNGVLMAALGLPAVSALERFRDRFQFQIAAL